MTKKSFIPIPPMAELPEAEEAVEAAAEVVEAAGEDPQ